MRVCMIVHAYYLKDARVRRYAELLAAVGHKVDVLCLQEGDEAPFEQHLGVSIHRINVSRHRGGMGSYILEYGLSFVHFFFKLNRLQLAAGRYELIHVHNFPNFLVFSAFFQKLSGSKIILDVHDPMPELFRSKFRIGVKHPLIRLLSIEERVSAWFADYVIAANHVFKDILVQRSSPPEKIEVILNSPDHRFKMDKELDRGLSREGRPFTVLYIGTLAERYGLETTLRAIKKIRDDGVIPDICLRVIPKIKNEGQYTDLLLQQASDLGLEDCFHLLDPVPHDEMPRIIREADLSVYTPLPDVHMDIALSLKIPEVIAVGRPLVASRLSVLQRYFGEDSLFMFRPGDVDECAERIVEVYRNPEEVKHRVQRAQEALREFSWETQKRTYDTILQNLISGHAQCQAGRPSVPSMRMLIKKMARQAISFATYYSGVGAARHYMLKGCGVRILCYHGIGPALTNSYAVSLENFDRQMQYLKSYFNVIPFHLLGDIILKNTPAPANSVVITFDDGFKSFYELAYPVLRKYGLPATCFLATSLLGDVEGNFMGWDDVGDIVKDGMVEIGSHTTSHRSLPSLDENRLRLELQESKSLLEEKLGIAVRFFSYPYGTVSDFNDLCTRAVAECGYELACTAVNGLNWQSTDPYMLKRTKVEFGDSMATFRRILRGALDIWAVIDHCFRFAQKADEVSFDRPLKAEAESHQEDAGSSRS